MKKYHFFLRDAEDSYENVDTKVIKLTPVLKDYIWGGNRLKKMFGRISDKKIAESWEISVHKDGLSGCEGGGTFADFLKANPFAVDREGKDFPVLIKYIDASENLSVQVHPNDEFALRQENENGKTEMWYVIRAEEGAEICCGFRRDTTREEFLEKVKDGTIAELLNYIPAKEGDCILIKAGTVHAICAGCVICEVQESSNLTYRIYDYGRKTENGNERALHIDKAKEVIDFHKFKNETDSGNFVSVPGGDIRLLTQCEYFRCRELLLNGTFTEQNDDCFVALNVLQGEGSINGKPFAQGDSYFIPCGEGYTLAGRAKFILTDEAKDTN